MTYRLDFATRTQGYNYQGSPWNAGKPTDANLAKFVALINGTGGDDIIAAEIVRESNGEVVANY